MSSSWGVFMRNVALGLVLMSLASQVCHAGQNYKRSYIHEGFYNGKCVQRGREFFGFLGRPRVVDIEKLVADLVWKRYLSNRTIIPALIRLQFHDCFVNGCDASILLEGDDTEKTARPNSSIRGDDLIDEIKDTIESICPGVVSCADILALATRDAIYFGSSKVRGNQPIWFEVQTGRRDGLVSLASNVVDLPPPTATVADSLKIFAKKNLNANDLVYLLGGGHSVGVTQCRFIQNRLSNFSNTGKPDPAMNPALVSRLQSYCNDPSKPVNLDQGTPDIVDNSVYKQVLFNKNGIFRGDQELASHPATKETVKAIALGSYRTFGINFGRAIVKMQSVGVLTGSQGEIRSSCKAVNSVL